MTRRTAIELAGVVIAVSAIVLVASRGNESSDEPNEPNRESQRGATKQGEKEGKDSADRKADEAETDQSGSVTKAEHRAARRAQERVSTNTFAAEKVLEVFGLHGQVRIHDEGRVVVVIIARSHACKAVPADEARIRKFLLDAVPSVRKVVVKVAGTGESLRSYVRANCGKPEFPGGPGRTVYRQRGEGFEKSKRFTIRGPKWAIDYQAMGASLFMLVSKGDKILAPGIAKQKRGTGTQVYKGSGRYRIDIRGSGFWKVRVRDGV